MASEKNDSTVELVTNHPDYGLQMTAHPALALARPAAHPHLDGAPEIDARGLRVLFVLKSFDPGGTEQVALRLASRFAAQGADVRLAVGRDRGVLQQQLRALPFFAVAGSRPVQIPSLHLTLHLARLVSKIRPDVVICPGNAYSLIGVVLRLRLRRKAPKLILKISNDLVRPDLPQPIRWLYHLWLRVQAPFFDALVAIAPPAEAEAQRMMRPGPGKLLTINDPALPAAERDRLAALRDATQRHHAGRHFVSIGRLVPQKNFALLIDSFADVAGPCDRLTILGEGPERQRLELQAVSRGVAHQVNLPGHCTDIAPPLAMADAFILASRYEGLPAVLVEALAAGIPVVATNCSINMPWLLEGVAHCVAINDRHALAAAMVAAASGDSRLEVDAMRRRAAAFDAERSAQRWLDLVISVAGPRPAMAA